MTIKTIHLEAFQVRVVLDLSDADWVNLAELARACQASSGAAFVGRLLADVTSVTRPRSTPSGRTWAEDFQQAADACGWTLDGWATEVVRAALWDPREARREAARRAARLFVACSRVG